MTGSPIYPVHLLGMRFSLAASLFTRATLFPLAPFPLAFRRVRTRHQHLGANFVASPSTDQNRFALGNRSFPNTPARNGCHRLLFPAVLQRGGARNLAVLPLLHRCCTCVDSYCVVCLSRGYTPLTTSHEGSTRPVDTRL